MTDINININNENGKIEVTSPYNNLWIDRCHQMGGKWNASKKVWAFDISNSELVEKALLEVYGWETNPETIKIRYKAADFISGNTVKIGNLTMAMRYYRDSYAKLFDTIVVEGVLPKSGGSMKHPRVIDDFVKEQREITFESEINKKVYENLSNDEKAKIEVIK